MTKSRFSEGNNLHRDGKFMEAIDAYRDSLDFGHMHDHIIFNKANALFDAGFHEQAVACYLILYNKSKCPDLAIRIRRFIPDPDNYLARTLNKILSQEDIHKYIVEALWGGYSFLSAVWLEIILIDSAFAPELRFYAAWHVARWYHYNSEFNKALDKVKFIRKYLNQDLANKKIVTMLAAYSYLGIERPEEAIQELNNFLENNPKDPDCLLALSNLQYSNEDRLSLINEVFANNNLRPISLIKLSEPLSLHNITCLADPVKGKKKVSVIIPAFNSEEKICTAIESLIAQSWQNLEIIIVDDCSTDSTFELAKIYEKKDKRVKALRQPHNAGAYAARNFGLEYATGDYITTHDADDWSHAEKIQKQVEFLDLNSKVKGVCLYWVRTKSNLQFTHNWRINPALIHWSHSSFMFRREVLEEIGPWDEVIVGGDTEFIWRIEAKYGKWSIKRIYKSVPMAFALDEEESLTRTKATHVRTIHYGLRHMYRGVATLWHQQNHNNDLFLNKTARPFALPLSMLERVNHACEVDVLYVSDFTDTVLTQKIADEIDHETPGKIYGLVHNPGFGAPRKEFSSPLFELCSRPHVHLVVAGQTVSCIKVKNYSTDPHLYRLDYFPCIVLNNS